MDAADAADVTAAAAAAAAAAVCLTKKKRRDKLRQPADDVNDLTGFASRTARKNSGGRGGVSLPEKRSEARVSKI